MCRNRVTVVEIVARITVRPSDRIAIAGRGDGRHLRDQAHSGQATLFGVFDVERVVIERGQRTDHAAQHRHRVGVVAKAAEEALQRLVHHGVMRDFMLEGG
jgi:hypothetical protein